MSKEVDGTGSVSSLIVTGAAFMLPFCLHMLMMTESVPLVVWWTGERRERKNSFSG